MNTSYRPPVGVPGRDQRRWQGWIISLLAHLFLLALLIIPTMRADADLGHVEGSGGAAPAGGGGGGAGGGDEEHLQFVGVVPPASPAAPAAQTRVAVPVVPPAPVITPQTTVPTVVKPVTPALPPTVVPNATTNGAVASGVGAMGGASTGAGSGAGVGSGSGGGVGSGEGTGKGSGVGPGTGGGAAKNYPPTPKEVFLPPLPAPAKLHGFHMTAWFDVDSLGNAKLLRFTPSPDNNYNKQLRETLLALKFRPGVRADGVPMRDTVDVQFIF